MVLLLGCSSADLDVPEPGAYRACDMTDSIMFTDRVATYCKGEPRQCGWTEEYSVVDDCIAAWGVLLCMGSDELGVCLSFEEMP